MNIPFFKKLKVIELANVLAGPAVGMFFSELGAKVIKIENKLTDGDVTRNWKLASEDKNSAVSAYYASVNWNKKNVFTDLTTQKDRQKIYTLIKKADIVISNYKAGDAIKLGMDYRSLKIINPNIIYAQITGFGNNSHRTAYDIVLQAETGFIHMNGNSLNSTHKMPVALIDILAAHQLKEGILVALIRRIQTGKGSKITVSLFDSAIASLANQASNWLMAKYDPQPTGSLHPNIAPYGETFTTADNKKIVLAIGNNKQFEKLVVILDLTELLSDNKFSSNTKRVKNRMELFELLASAIVKHNSKRLMNRFIKSDVPAGVIKSVKEVFNNNNLRSFILREKQGKEDTKRVKTAIFDLSV